MLIKVAKVFVDYEKEEKWLNEMSAKGLNFESKRYINRNRKLKKEKNI